MNLNPIKVSVVVLAYNHEPFLRQALDGVLGQLVDFDYEVIVGEDCSTDQTRRIVRDYEQRYPALLKPIYHPHNVGMGANFHACLQACQGQYIALLEGDDYWTSPLKLQRQVAWLDQHPDFTICFHPVLDHYEDGSRPDAAPHRFKQDVYTFDDFLTPIYTIVSTSATMLRNVRPTWPAWLFTVKPIDFSLVLLYTELGKAKLLPEVMSAYRIHAGGIWSGTPRYLNIKSFLLMYRQLWLHYAATSHGPKLRRHLFDLYLTTANVYANSGLPAEARDLLREALRLEPARYLTDVPALLGAGLRLARSLARHQRAPGRAVAGQAYPLA